MPIAHDPRQHGSVASLRVTLRVPLAIQQFPKEPWSAEDDDRV